MNDLLLEKVDKLKGVGLKRAQLLDKLGVTTVYSLLYLFPRSYIDVTHPVPIAETLVGDTCTIRAKVFKKAPERRIRKGLSLFKVFVTDGVADLVVTIFNNKYAYMALELDKTYLLHGKIGGNSLRREMSSPLVIADDQELTMRPVYRLTEGLTNKMITTNQEEAISIATVEAFEPLPRFILEKYELCGWNYAIQRIHFPPNGHELELARKRLIFEELLVWQIGLVLTRSKNTCQTSIEINRTDLSGFLNKLEFELTGAQQRVINECIEDIKKSTPMNRLIQGDVGSGKTMVAAALCYVMRENGYQSAMMAPTEILAAQHFKTLSDILEPIGTRICLLTGSMTKSQKEGVKEQIAAGEYDLVVGTHALIQDSTVFSSLGLVITDEQHRFGVNQRQKLTEKGDNPHVMVMSATPIPRTLALIVYGDLDISVVDEMPKGRQKIDTFAITPGKRNRAYGFIQKQLTLGRQAYIVCPMIEEGEDNTANVTEYAESLKDTCLGTYRIAALHGKLSAEEKDGIMNSFKQGEIQVLVSTTVVEVGVDVPNAVIMMIENAEMFGLSQLHQLRGRVGRGDYKSYCILVSGLNTEENKHRLKTMCETSDGFVIAEQDLKLRGPGDFFGNRQHGLPCFKIADMLEDIQVLKSTQRLAKAIVEKDPNLGAPEFKGVKWLVERLLNEQQLTI